MKFSKLKTKLVKHTLEFKFLAKTSRDELKTKDTWFLSLTDEKGTTGIGECSIIAGLSIENPEAFEKKLNHVSEKFSEYENYHESLVKFPAIRFGVETALLDLKTGGKRELFPTDFILKQKPLSINGLVWMGDRAFMSSQVKEKIAAGFSCIKLKIGALDFEQELEIIKSIRNEYSASDIDIRVDALDEELIGVHSKENKKELLEIIQPQYIILKPSLLGGFKASDEWISLANKNDINYWNTSALESNIGLNAISQWTSSLNNPLPQGLGTGGLYSNNIDSPLTVKNGEISYDTSQEWDLKHTK